MIFGDSTQRAAVCSHCSCAGTAGAPEPSPEGSSAAGIGVGLGSLCCIAVSGFTQGLHRVYTKLSAEFFVRSWQLLPSPATLGTKCPLHPLPVLSPGPVCCLHLPFVMERINSTAQVPTGGGKLCLPFFLRTGPPMLCVSDIKCIHL